MMSLVGILWSRALNNDTVTHRDSMPTSPGLPQRQNSGLEYSSEEREEGKATLIHWHLLNTWHSPSLLIRTPISRGRHRGPWAFTGHLNVCIKKGKQTALWNVIRAFRGPAESLETSQGVHGSSTDRTRRIWPLNLSPSLWNVWAHKGRPQSDIPSSNTCVSSAQALTSEQLAWDILEVT